MRKQHIYEQHEPKANSHCCRRVAGEQLAFLSYFFQRREINFPLMVVKGKFTVLFLLPSGSLGTGVLICSTIVTIKVLMPIKFCLNRQIGR